jgi:hypothetical protein
LKEIGIIIKYKKIAKLWVIGCRLKRTTPNSFLTAIDLLQNSDAILPYPVNMKVYFETFNIVPLRMQECFNRATIRAYLHKDGRQDKQSIELLEQLKKLIKGNPHIKGEG